MKKRDILCAFIVALIWGSNFVVVKSALADLPPFLFLTIRFFLTAVPLIFFVPKPNVSWLLVAAVSVLQWVIHFSCIFSALALGIDAGLASLLTQTQTLFTVLLSMIVFGYRPSPLQLIGILIAFCGIFLIGHEVGLEGNTMSFVLLIIAAISVSGANIVYRGLGNVNMFSLIVWSSFIPIAPMFGMSCVVEGWDTIVSSLSTVSFHAMAAVIYTAWVSTFIAANLWGRLMNRYEPSQVVPFSMLIPVVGISVGCYFLGETMTLTEGAASIVIISGLLINQCPAWIAQRRLRLQEKQIISTLAIVEDETAAVETPKQAA